MALRIAVVVHGRFHAFDLTRELLRLGHDVALFTNYPRFVARRFGIPPQQVRSFLAHGVGSRLAWRLLPGGLGGNVERVANLAFGRWAARRVAQQDWDAVIAFSGVAEEVFRTLNGKPTFKVLQRGSAHIRVQQQILLEEERRAGCRLNKPSDWIVAREQREYALADVIHVLSNFAARSFTDQGVDPKKLFLLRLGVSTDAFRAPPEVIESRCKRILAGEPLRVLNVGTFSHQKGSVDFAHVIQHPSSSRFRFRFVGPVAKAARTLYRQLRGHAEFVRKRPQWQLPREYEWGDVFVLPTVQDGFAMVLCQALAAGLPVIATTNCAAPDLIAGGKNGWVTPIRNPQALIERLIWLDCHRDELIAAIRFAAGASVDLDWSETGRRAEENILSGIARIEPPSAATRGFRARAERTNEMTMG
jgi:glycosyltransferase involved in cell wall biosynthesis